MKKTLVVALVSSLLMSCTQTETFVINASCAGFRLIKASREDSTETLRQIKVHNQSYREICQEEMLGAKAQEGR